MFSYFEPNFNEKFFWEGGFSNFGHVIVFAKLKLVYFIDMPTMPIPKLFSKIILENCILTKKLYFQKIQQANLHDPPGKVAVTCRKLQYHSNSHKNNTKKLS